MDPNRQSDPYDAAPKRSMDGVRRTNGPVVPTQPVRPIPVPVPKKVPRSQPAPKLPKQKSDRHVVRAVAQAFLAIAVILAVAAAIVWLYLRYYQ